MQIQSYAGIEDRRATLGRALLVFSLVLFLAGLTLPALAGEPAHGNTMCADVPIGAASVEVNGAGVGFTWTESGVAWSVTGADSNHFRVYLHSNSGTDVIWGASGSWAGDGLRSVTACHCPQRTGTTTTTGPKTTTTTKPTMTTAKATTTTTTTTTTTGPKTTTTTKPTTTTASTTTASTTTTIGAVVSPTTVVAPSSTTSTTTPPSSVTPAGPATSSTPIVAVLPRQVVRAQQLPATGVTTSLLALVGSALVGIGGLAVSGGRRFRH